MFRGITAINLDDKGRLAIPTRYREHLNNGSDGQIVVTIDTEERCLLMYPLLEWEVIEQKLQNLPSFNKAARRIQRLLIGHATEIDLDRSGRVLLPPLLREYAELDKQVMLVGQGKKFEIWGDQQWGAGRTGWLADDPDESSLPPELQMLSL